MRNSFLKIVNFSLLFKTFLKLLLRPGRGLSTPEPLRGQWRTQEKISGGGFKVGGPAS